MLSIQKEVTEDVIPRQDSQHSDNTSPALSGMVKAALGQMRENLKKNKERERALSTVTQMPDDIAWRDAEDLASVEDDSDLSDDPGASRHQRRSAEEAPKHIKVSLCDHCPLWSGSSLEQHTYVPCSHTHQRYLCAQAMPVKIVVGQCVCFKSVGLADGAQGPPTHWFRSSHTAAGAFQ